MKEEGKGRERGGGEGGRRRLVTVGWGGGGETRTFGPEHNEQSLFCVCKVLSLTRQLDLGIQWKKNTRDLS